MTRLQSLMAVLLAATLLSGCAAGIEWQPESGAWTDARLRALLTSATAADLAEQPVNDSARLRKRALVGLRGKGDEASKAADLITATFPPETRAVPYFAAAGAYAGEKATIVAEAYGVKGGRLAQTRVWVVAPDGEILFAAAGPR